MQTKILAAMCQSRDAFDLVYPHVGERELGAQGSIITKHIGEFYDRDPDADSVDFELLGNSLKRTLSNPKHELIFERILTTIQGTEVSEANVVNDVLAAKLQAVGMDLSAALATNDEKRVKGLLDEYAEIQDATSITDDTASFNNITVKELFEEHLNDEQLVKILPKAINDRLNGGLLRGQHMVIFARPELGKTALAVTIIRGCLLQDLRVLYISNEDLPATLAQRTMSCLTGLTENQLRADPDGAQAKLEKHHWDNLFIEELTPGTVREIRNLVAKLKPDVLIVDQLRNVATGDEGKTVQLEEAAKGVRNIAKIHKCVAVSITQAWGEAENKLTLNSNDIDGSKTGIPGACEVLIGMGADSNYKLASMRRLSLCKNKRGGGHGTVDTNINDFLSRIT